MITRVQVLSAMAAGILVCGAVGAQTRGSDASQAVGSRPAPAPAVHVRPAAPRNSGPTSTGRVSAPSRTAQPPIIIQPAADGRTPSGFAGTGGFVNVQSSNNNFDSVPGLGFDYPHLAAISGGRNGRSFSHFDHRGNSGQGVFVPIFWGGYPFYEDVGYDQDYAAQLAAAPAQPQPQIIVIQQPVPALPASLAAGGAAIAETPAPPPDAASAAAAVPDVGDFILVRRDGRVLFASAYSVTGAQLHYVTPEGVRHTVAVAELDAEATQQMNEARGTSVQIRN